MKVTITETFASQNIQLNKYRLGLLKYIKVQIPDGLKYAITSAEHKNG